MRDSPTWLLSVSASQKRILGFAHITWGWNTIQLWSSQPEKGRHDSLASKAPVNSSVLKPQSQIPFWLHSASLLLKSF